MRSALRSAASMCFPSSNNVSVIYERLGRKTQRCAIGPLSLPLFTIINSRRRVRECVCVCVSVGVRGDVTFAWRPMLTVGRRLDVRVSLLVRVV